jgi:hypothetical protein
MASRQDISSLVKVRSSTDQTSLNYRNISPHKSGYRHQSGSQLTPTGVAVEELETSEDSTNWGIENV